VLRRDLRRKAERTVAVRAFTQGTWKILRNAPTRPGAYKLWSWRMV
jgi:hypothetical protein